MDLSKGNETTIFEDKLEPGISLPISPKRIDKSDNGIRRFLIIDGHAFSTSATFIGLHSAHHSSASTSGKKIPPGVATGGYRWQA